MSRIALSVCLAALFCAACGGSYNGKTPASSGVQALIAALGSDEPHRAYSLLSDDVKAKVSFREFEQQWRQSAAERAWRRHAAVRSTTFRGKFLTPPARPKKDNSFKRAFEQSLTNTKNAVRARLSA